MRYDEIEGHPKMPHGIRPEMGKVLSGGPLTVGGRRHGHQDQTNFSLFKIAPFVTCSTRARKLMTIIGNCLRQSSQQSFTREDLVRERADVIAEASARGVKVHSGELRQLCFIKKTQLPSSQWTYRGRVVFLRNNVRDQDGYLTSFWRTRRWREPHVRREIRWRVRHMPRQRRRGRSCQRGVHPL